MPGASVVDGQCVMTCKMHIFECARVRCKCMHYWLKERFIQAALPGWVHFRKIPVFFFVCFSLVSECTYTRSHCRDNSPGPRLCTRHLSSLQGMSSAVLTVTPCTLCSSSRKAAVATYSRAISSLRLALGSPRTLSGSFRGSYCYRAFPALRCESAAAAAPAKASSQQVLSV